MLPASPAARLPSLVMLGASAGHAQDVVFQPRRACRPTPSATRPISRRTGSPAPSRGASCAPRATACWPPARTSGQHRALSRRPWCSTPTTPRPGSGLPARCSPSSRTRAASATTCPSTPRAPPGTPTSARQAAGDQGGGALVLHEAFKRRSFWRAADRRAPGQRRLSRPTRPRRRRRWRALVAEHGFRIAEYKVDSDAAQPRLCIQFSEALASGQVDWAQYFQVDGKDPQAVTAEARQICVDGLAHGKRYEVQVRAGLPSAIRGETLIKTAELAVYVKDRAPSVRAVGRSYVLPNRGQQGIPLVTVNTDKVEVEVYRIGDRSIAQVLQSGDFQRQLTSYDLSTLKEKSGAQVYPARCRSPPRLNEDVTTAFPGGRGDPAPGARRLRARGLMPRPRRTTATAAARGDAVVHRLRPRPHRHQRRRRRARLRALARHRRAGRRRRRAPDRAQQRGARHGQDRRPRLRALRSRACCAARAGRRPPCWWPRPRPATTRSSTWPPPPSTSPIAASTAGPSPGPVDALRLSPTAASIAPARRCT